MALSVTSKPLDQNIKSDFQKKVDSSKTSKTQEIAKTTLGTDSSLESTSSLAPSNAKGQQKERYSTELHLYAAKGNVEGLKKLFEKEANPDQADSKGRTPLGIAAQKGQLKAVEFLLAAGAGINAPTNNKKQTALLLAAEAGHEAVVRYLLNNKADASATDKCNNRALQFAIWNKHAKVAEIILVRVEDKVLNEAGLDYLCCACFRGLTTVVEKLLARKVNPAQPVEGKYLPLVSATNSDDPKLIYLLVKAGAPVDARDDISNTALDWAIYHDNLAAAKALLECGANVNNTERWQTPLAQAAIQGKTGLVRLFLKYKADVDLVAQEKYSYTAFLGAVLFGQLECAEILRKHKPECINVKNPISKGSAAHLLLIGEKDKTQAIKYLLSIGIDLGITDDSGKTIFEVALEKGLTWLVEELIASETGIAVLKKGKVPALHLAAAMANSTMMEKIRAAGFDVNSVDELGETSLRYTYDYGRAENANWLLKNGAKTDTQNKYGSTLLHNVGTIYAGYTKGRNPSEVRAAREAIARMVLAKKPDLSVKNKWNNAPFYLIYSPYRQEFISKLQDPKAKLSYEFARYFER